MSEKIEKTCDTCRYKEYRGRYATMCFICQNKDKYKPDYLMIKQKNNTLI
jgi:hypothetical protein